MGSYPSTHPKKANITKARQAKDVEPIGLTTGVMRSPDGAKGLPGETTGFAVPVRSDWLSHQDEFGQCKVHNRHAAVARKHDIRRLHVPMHQSLFVSGCEVFRSFAYNFDGLPWCQFAITLGSAVEALAVNGLYFHEIQAALLAGAIDGNRVGMIKLRCTTRIAKKALYGHFVTCSRVLRKHLE